MQIRTIHAYVGMFIAPSVIFYAFTGLLQIYNLHQGHRGYAPPPLIEKLAMIHKDQRFALGGREPPPSERRRSAVAPVAPQPPGPTHGDDDLSSSLATKLLKAFFAAVAIGLMFSTAAGVWMALQQPLRRRAHLALLMAGLLLPMLLAALTT